jgi:hypothetical protein
MEHQQRLLGRSFGAVMLLAGGTKLEDLRPLSEDFGDAVARVAAGEVLHVRKRV